MTWRALFFGGVLTALFSPVPASSSLTADAILAKSDAIRVPAGDHSVIATVISVDPNGRKDKATYEVWLKGINKTVIKTLAPVSDRGTSILMLGHDLWAFLPMVAKPIRISLQQRLLGEVSNGDLARTNFVGDYRPELVESKPNFYVLQLRAKSDDVTYGSIKLWIDRPTFRPLKAAFYAESGRLLKVGSYEDFKPMAGATRPSRLVITDAVVRGQVSTIYYEKITARDDLAEKYFTKDYLKKLKY